MTFFLFKNRRRRKKLKGLNVLFFILVIIFFAGRVIVGFSLFNFESPIKDSSLKYEGRVSFGNLYSLEFSKKVKVFLLEKILDLTPSKLDGELVFTPSLEKESTLAVMIENHVDSREQMKGLGKASIVYEVIAEGAITRFLAIFSYQDDELVVGPVRSARPYFVTFAKEYLPSYSHAGGSPRALKGLYKDPYLLNIDALYYEGLGTFWRDKNYYAPHNLFGSLGAIREVMKKQEWKRGLTESHFKFGEIDSSLETCEESEDVSNCDKDGENIEINFSNRLYKVEWKYDLSTGLYNRFLAGKKHIDHSDDSQIKAANILIQVTDFWPYDNYGRLEMVVIGKGPAVLYRDGKRFEGVWEKKKEGEKTVFKTVDGKEFVLKPGTTWIELVKKGML